MSSGRSLKFDIDADEYQVFRFTLRRPARVRIRIVASEPVNVLLLDRDERLDYESQHDDELIFTAQWRCRDNLEVTQTVDAGQWAIVIEGDESPSVGIIDVRVG